MKSKIFDILKDTTISSLPLVFIIIVCLFISPLDSAGGYLRIVVGCISVIIGQALFIVGLESSILPIGRMVGSSFSKYNNLLFIIFFGFVFGLLATVAEPALSVLSRQISGILPVINSTLFIWITGAGIGLGVAVALLRIVKNGSIKKLFFILYVLVFALVVFAPEEFVSIAFDGSGATTGDVSVPFILVLGIGISNTFSKSKTNDDSLGIIGISSVGPILAILLYGIIVKFRNGGVIPLETEYVIQNSTTLGNIVLGNLKDVALAILPIVLMSLPFLIFLLKIPKKEIFTLILGVMPLYLGLLIFLSGIDYGFEFVGRYIGSLFFGESLPYWFRWMLLPVAFVLGIAITVSEPAVTVLGNQIEDLTNGHIKNISIRCTLAIGIGFAALLSVLKILTGINILYFLVPLYTISLIMMKFTPTLFVGLAFDSGGVTGGALTSAFLTPLTLSIAQSVAISNGTKMSVLTNGFGIISFISVTPLIAVQALGIIYNYKLKAAESTVVEDEFDDLESYFIDSDENTGNESEGEIDD